MLAAAIRARFGDAQIIKAWADGKRFYADVVLGSPWEKEYLPLIEGELGNLLKETLFFEEIELAVGSALGLFSLKKQELLPSSLPSDKKALVSLLRCGDWAIPLIPPRAVDKGRFFILAEAKEVGTFAEDPIYRFTGETSEEPIKKIQCLPDATIEDLFRKSDLGWSYLPRGEAVRERLLRFWKKIVKEQNFLLIKTPQGLNQEDTLEEMRPLGRVAQVGYIVETETLYDYGILTPEAGYHDLFSLTVSEKDAVSLAISYLQMIRQIPNIFSFETQMVLRVAQASPDRSFFEKALGSSIDVIEPSNGSTELVLRLFDREGCAWDGPMVAIGKAKSGLRTVFGSLLGSWERFIALLLQKEQGIPFELVEEQVRIFPLRPELLGYADTVRERLERVDLRTQIDSQEMLLKQRIHEALKERVPYVIVVGPEEAASQTISWRSGDVEKRGTIEEFVTMVKL